MRRASFAYGGPVLALAAMERANVGDDFGLLERRNSSGGEISDQRAFAEKHDAVGEIERFIEIVSYEKHGLVQALRAGRAACPAFRRG